MPFTSKNLEIKDVILIEPRVFPDGRGFFLESYKSSDFKKIGIPEPFVQDNHSLSVKGVLRGLHYQLPPKAQGKLVRVIKGAVIDVAVDIRKNSPTFKKWVAEELSEENHRMLYIPPGFAHGFAALTDDVHLLYKCTEEYSPECDRGIRWDDPEISVDWKIGKPIVSEKDEVLPLLKNAEVFP
ncbi:MAG: dTDP-4-dehydrorhamnose 3,5-epimerase [Spirochaetes bacterium]|jgi:dTDP-4-dehydrorhamnose 3,5-epimerase|nr:dTDP-4-dehydrorhamnose 3,5-epimerase [Spirochaetota bacterium]